MPQLQILRKPVGSQPWVLFMEVYPCSSWVFCSSHALIFFATDWGTHRVQLLFQAAWSGTRTLSKAYGFPHRHLKCCLAITNQGCLQIFQEEGSSGKGRDLLVRRHAVSLIAQPGLCCCFPHGRQGNLQAVAVLQINHLRQVLQVCLELWLLATMTLSSGFQLSSDTSARWKGKERAHG